MPMVILYPTLLSCLVEIFEEAWQFLVLFFDVPIIKILPSLSYWIENRFEASLLAKTELASLCLPIFGMCTWESIILSLDWEFWNAVISAFAIWLFMFAVLLVTFLFPTFLPLQILCLLLKFGVVLDFFRSWGLLLVLFHSSLDKNLVTSDISISFHHLVLPIYSSLTCDTFLLLQSQLCCWLFSCAG